MKNNKKLIIISSIIIVLSLFLTYINVKDIYQNKVKTIKIETTTNKEDYIEDEVTTLKRKYNNNDIKAIIKIPGLENFNYPVAQADNNSFYLSHDYYKNYDKYGSVYEDYRTNIDESKKVLMYGHNSSFRDTQFKPLENYYKKEFYENNKYIYITTPNNTYKYEIFSVFVEYEDFTYVNIKFNTDESWYHHLKKLQNKSMYKIDTKISKNDKILIMQTCSNNPDYQKYEKKFLLIISKRVEDNDDVN